MRHLAIAIVFGACGHQGPDLPAEMTDAGGSRQVDASVRAPDAAVALGDAALVDSAHSDAAVADGATSPAPLTELGMVSCWSVGGFQAVYHDQPAHIVVTLMDPDGIADIDATAEVTIIGHYGSTYDVGARPLESLGNSGCCTTSVKVPIYYDDFVASAQAVGTDGSFFSAYATFRDHGGATVTARCDNAWFLDDAYYGN